MIVTAQIVKGGIVLNDSASTHGVTFTLSFKQAETLAYTLLKMVEKHNQGK